MVLVLTACEKDQIGRYDLGSYVYFTQKETASQSFSFSYYPGLTTHSLEFEVNLMGDLLTEDKTFELYIDTEKTTATPDMYELTKGDIDKRYNAYKTATDSGWLQVDEVRERENMEPLGMNMIKLGLQDVLYDPKTQMLYVPNTNQMHKLGEGGNGEGESK